eukprot:11099102-Prorocentrum_lima.AAC.1
MVEKLTEPPVCHLCGITHRGTRFLAWYEPDPSNPQHYRLVNPVHHDTEVKATINKASGPWRR